MSTLKQRFERLHAMNPHLSKADLARAAGVKPPSVQGWFSGTSASMKAHTASKIASLYGVNAHWLATGEGDMQPPDVHKVTEIARAYGGKYVLASGDDIPDGSILIKESRVRLSGGPGALQPTFEEVENSTPASYRREWLIKEGLNPIKLRRFQVVGRSMERLLFHGDTVLVNLAENEIRDGGVYAFLIGDELRVKRLYRKLDGGLVMHSDNEEFRPRDEELGPMELQDRFFLLGRVRERSGKGGLDF